MIQSRMNVAFRKYRRSHAEADLVLIEPNKSDEEIFFTNIFSFDSRQALCNHAYRITRRDLLSQADQFDQILERHKLKLNRDILKETDRTLLDSLDEQWFGHSPVSRQLSQILDDLEWELDKHATP